MSKRGIRSNRVNKSRASIAMEHQNRLISILEEFPENQVLAKSSAKQLLAVSKKNRLPLPTRAKLLLCRKCSLPFSNGENMRIRLRNGVKIVTCLSCDNTRRYILK